MPFWLSICTRRSRLLQQLKLFGKLIKQNIRQMIFIMHFKWDQNGVVSQDSCSYPARAAMLHPGMKSVKLCLLTLLVLFSDSLFTFVVLLNSGKHLLLTELLFLAFMITVIGITVYPCAGLSKFYVVTITHLRADQINWKCKV